MITAVEKKEIYCETKQHYEHSSDNAEYFCCNMRRMNVTNFTNPTRGQAGGGLDDGVVDLSNSLRRACFFSNQKIYDDIC